MREKIQRWFMWSLMGLWALAFCQAPEFILQYQRVLAGHVQELNHQKKTLDEMFDGHSLDAVLQEVKEPVDPLANKQKAFIEQLLQRQKSFSTSLERLQSAYFWSRPFVFLAAFHPSVFSATLCAFQPGLPLSLEALLLGLLGLLAGYAVYRLILFTAVSLKALFSKETK